MRLVLGMIIIAFIWFCCGILVSKQYYKKKNYEFYSKGIKDTIEGIYHSYEDKYNKDKANSIVIDINATLLEFKLKLEEENKRNIK